MAVCVCVCMYVPSYIESMQAHAWLDVRKRQTRLNSAQSFWEIEWKPHVYQREYYRLGDYSIFLWYISFFRLHIVKKLFNSFLRSIRQESINQMFTWYAYGFEHLSRYSVHLHIFLPDTLHSIGLQIQIAYNCQSSTEKPLEIILVEKSLYA